MSHQGRLLSERESSPDACVWAMNRCYEDMRNLHQIQKKMERRGTASQHRPLECLGAPESAISYQRRLSLEMNTPPGTTSHGGMEIQCRIRRHSNKKESHGSPGTRVSAKQLATYYHTAGSHETHALIFSRQDTEV